jgi:hypothetical protein
LPRSLDDRGRFLFYRRPTYHPPGQVWSSGSPFRI